MSNVAQRSFAGGEIAPELYGRTDEAKYATGLRLCRNFVIQRHGGVTNRSGTQFVCEVKNSAKKVRLVEFIFNSGQTYMLEFGDLYMRVIRLGAQITVAPNPWNVATAYFVNDCVSLAGVNYLCIQANTGTGPPNAAFWYPLTGVIYEIPTPYAVADLPLLQYVQSADVVTIVHPLYQPAELKRTGHANWTLTPITFGPLANIPLGPMVIGGGAAGANLYWAVTSIQNGTFEESLPLVTVAIANKVPSVGTPTSVQWNTATNSYGYNIYRSTDGVTFGKVGFVIQPPTGSVAFSDTGTTPDLTTSPPVLRDILNGASKWPSCVCFYQQRRLFGNTTLQPEYVFASRTGFYYNFGIRFPVQTDDAVTWSLSGQQVNAVQHMFDMGFALIVFTTDGEWNVEGDQSGILRPGSINPKQYSYHGANFLKPLNIGNILLYVQARGTIVRNIEPDYYTRFKGKDMTIYSAHLFNNLSLLSWAYQEQPHSIVWAARSDGTLLGLTYIPDQDVWGWHRHDTDGLFEDVKVIPENAEDKAYLVVNRTINGVTKRYIEYFNNRLTSNVENSQLVDCGLTYDGTNITGTTMTLSGGVTWDGTELMTLTASAPSFAAGDAGTNAVFLTDPTGNIIRFSIVGFTSGNVVTGRASEIIPVALRNVATTTWTKAVRTFTGLGYLEGKNVSVLGDGFVVASPNNAAYPLLKVVGGSVTLDQPYGIVRIGLPYISDLMTLDIDSASGASLKDKFINVNRTIFVVKDTRGVWAGMQPPTNDLVDPLQGLAEYKARSNEDASLPIALLTDTISVNIESNWNSNGRIFLRQVDPLPITVLAAIPTGFIT